MTLYIGTLPEIDELFPPQPLPVKATPQADVTLKSKPTSTGVGFFTPDGGGGGGGGGGGNFLKTWKLEGQMQSFKMGLPHGRESMYVEPSWFNIGGSLS